MPHLYCPAADIHMQLCTKQTSQGHFTVPGHCWKPSFMPFCASLTLFLVPRPLPREALGSFGVVRNPNSIFFLLFIFISFCAHFEELIGRTDLY